jgi:hypothetical protein
MSGIRGIDFNVFNIFFVFGNVYMGLVKKLTLSNKRIKDRMSMEGMALVHVVGWRHN